MNANRYKKYSNVASALYAFDTTDTKLQKLLNEAGETIETLMRTLELSDKHDLDGIDCRNSEIELLEKEIQYLKDKYE